MRNYSNKNSSANNSENDLMHEQLGNDVKNVIKLSKKKINSNSNRTNTSNRSNLITKWFQKFCYCFSTKRIVLGVNTSNIGIANSAGFGTSYALDSSTNDIILFVQSVGSIFGITGAVRDNIWLLGLCTTIYSVMAVWCFFFLLDVGQAMYYTGIAYPNWLYIDELRNSSIDASYQEDGSAEAVDNSNTSTPYYQHTDAVIMEQTSNANHQTISSTTVPNANTSVIPSQNLSERIDIEAQPKIPEQGESNTKRKWFRIFQRK